MIISILLEVFLFLLLVFIILFTNTLIHEFGHALMYMIFFKKSDWQIKMGRGKPKIEFKRLILAPYFLRGSIAIKSKLNGSKFKCIMFYLGGPIFNVFVICALLYFYSQIRLSDLNLIISNSALVAFWEIAFYSAVIQFIFCIIPMKYRDGTISDGMRVKLVLTE